MSERPFMQLYVSDFIGDTLSLSTEQIGAYMLLLMAMWNAGGRLPSDEAKLARVARMSVKKWKAISGDLIPFFEVGETDIRHSRLTKELQKSESKSQSRASAGAAGGRSKALKDKQSRIANADCKPQHLPDTITRDIDANASISKKREFEREFDETFWPAYPLKVGKPNALKAFISARQRADLSAIMDGVKRYASERIGQDKKYTKQAQGWLNRDGWADEPIPANDRGRATGPPARKSEYRQHQDDVKQRFDEFLGTKRDDEFASSGTAFDLEPGDWRSH